ncbi:ras guanine nucleotide exchange factor domain-containing protein [Spinellus fusiger]|nr:ras guanine nucleotide exchange factor domain-containing protein [Spinellus fusiger]
MSPKSSTTPVKNIGQNTPSTTSSPNSERKKEAAAYSKYQYDFLPPRVNQTQTYKKGSLYYISENGKDVLVLKKVDCKMHVVAGTVKKLLEKLADDTAQDLDYVDTLLMSYTYFTDSLTLLESLITRFHPPERPGRLSHVQKPSKCIQAKVLNVISRWAKLQCQDFKEITLRKQLLQFIENRVTQAGFSIEASLIQNLLDTQLEQHAHKRHSLVALSSYSQSYFSAWSMSMEENTYPPSPSSSIPSSSICRPPTVPNAMSFSSFNSNTPPASPTLISPVFGLNLVPGIMSLKAKDIAKYLTIADFYIFRCITAYEYMHGPWRDSPPEQEGVINTSDSISLITQRANMISHWVIHDICTCQSPKQQRNVIKHFIEVAKLCLEWNNFHTSMVITMGLLSTSVQRLQDIWQSLSHRDTHTFGLLQRNLDVGNNMAVYRQALEKIKPPIIPFFPLILKDITFFMEGNSTLLTQSEGLINFSKFRSLVQFLDIVLKYTSENYWFAGDLENLLFFPEALVHRVSRGAPLDSVAELVELRIQSVSKCYKDPQCGVLLV